MRYKLLGDTGLRVSEMALGTMTFGEDWGWGAPKKACKEIFDTYVDAGGNFLDTAVNYTDGTSEKILGDLIEGDRERFVLATKYTLSTDPGDPNAGGSHKKNLRRSIDASLDRLGTDHVDLLWVHAWDPLTPLEKTMRALDDLVREGKVLHVGFSDAPAWVVARAQTLAQERDWTPFSAIQIRYHLADRTPEHELLPMADELGLSATIWSPLAQGKLTGKYLDEAEGSRGRIDDVGWELTDRETEIARTVVDVADETDASPAQVALAWIRHAQPDAIPILGARTLDQLRENIQSRQLELDDEHLERLEDVSAVDPIFPGNFLGGDEMDDILYGGTLDQIDTDRL
jgi:aryl-alcohol dehydrogenase-like predicted oxidoreductase